MLTEMLCRKRGIILSNKTEFCPLDWYIVLGMMVTNKYLKYQSNISNSKGNRWGGTKKMTKSFDTEARAHRMALLLYKYNSQAKNNFYP